MVQQKKKNQSLQSLWKKNSDILDVNEDIVKT